MLLSRNPQNKVVSPSADIAMSKSASMLPLTVNHLTLRRNKKNLLDDISFSLNDKNITIILGANGAGKTLLLKTCHGLIKPSFGHIYWREKNKQAINHNQAMVFQRPVLLHRSVVDNIEYVLKIRKIEKKTRRKILHQSLQMTGLVDLQQRQAHFLSGGEQQRVALARAWAAQPEILFLDEITANLDPSATAVTEKLIKLFAANGIKIIMTTHDLNQAKRLAKEILFLHQGKLLQQKTADEFFNNPENAIAEAFLTGKLIW